jgi:hypothetical protein
MRWTLAALAALSGLTAAAAPPGVLKPAPPAATAATAAPAPAPSDVPSDAECRALPALRPQAAFLPGETLDFELDALGAKAGTMTMRVLPVKDGLMPLQVEARSSAFISNVRRVRGTGTSFVNPRTLRPRRYLEQSVENEVERTSDVRFTPRVRRAELSWKSGARTGRLELAHGSEEALDVAGAVYALRQLPLKEGQKVCVDVYGVRRMWRVFGTVQPREHVSLEVGEFEAWHLAGVAVRLDNPRARREVHLWISDDARRLPLAALGTIDLGVVRATLTGFQRPGERGVKSEPKSGMKW